MDLTEFAEKFSAGLDIGEDDKYIENHIGEKPDNSKTINGRDENILEKKCYTCNSQDWWQKKGLPGRWICSICHRPAIAKNEIVWRSNS